MPSERQGNQNRAPVQRIIYFSRFRARWHFAACVPTPFSFQPRRFGPADAKALLKALAQPIKIAVIRSSIVSPSLGEMVE